MRARSAGPSGSVDSQSARTTCWLCATMRVLRVVGRSETAMTPAPIDVDRIEQFEDAPALRVVADGAGERDARADRP